MGLTPFVQPTGDSLFRRGIQDSKHGVPPIFRGRQPPGQAGRQHQRAHAGAYSCVSPELRPFPRRDLQKDALMLTTLFSRASPINNGWALAAREPRPSADQFMCCRNDPIRPSSKLPSAAPWCALPAKWAARGSVERGQALGGAGLWISLTSFPVHLCRPTVTGHAPGPGQPEAEGLGTETVSRITWSWGNAQNLRAPSASQHSVGARGFLSAISLAPRSALPRGWSSCSTDRKPSLDAATRRGPALGGGRPETGTWSTKPVSSARGSWWTCPQWGPPPEPASLVHSTPCP